MQKKSKWLIRNRKAMHHSYKLFCFPYAGGTANIYREWQDKFNHCEIIGVEPPGRGGRLLENPYDNIHELAMTLLSEIESHLNGAFSFFGHSNGALIAFELTRILQNLDMPLPQKLFLSAKNPPHNIKEEKISNLSLNQFIERLRSYNGTSEDVLANRELFELILPTLRADFSISENYILKNPVTLNTELHIYSGNNDPHVDNDLLEEWGRYSTRTIGPRFFTGDHFYFSDDPKEVISAIQDTLSAVHSC